MLTSSMAICLSRPAFQKWCGRRKVLPAETVALAVGLVSEQELYKKLRGEVVQLFLVGDGRKAQNIMNAVWDAYEVARTI